MIRTMQEQLSLTKRAGMETGVEFCCYILAYAASILFMACGQITNHHHSLYEVEA